MSTLVSFVRSCALLIFDLRSLKLEFSFGWTVWSANSKCFLVSAFSKPRLKTHVYVESQLFLCIFCESNSFSHSELFLPSSWGDILICVNLSSSFTNIEILSLCWGDWVNVSAIYKWFIVGRNSQGVGKTTIYNL